MREYSVIFKSSLQLHWIHWAVRYSHSLSSQNPLRFLQDFLLLTWVTSQVIIHKCTRQVLLTEPRIFITFSFNILHPIFSTRFLPLDWFERMIWMSFSQDNISWREISLLLPLLLSSLVVMSFSHLLLFFSSCYSFTHSSKSKSTSTGHEEMKMMKRKGKIKERQEDCVWRQESTDSTDW